ncbi:MAG: hypothetical protein ACRD72_09030, partial [Candidatus Angelobacter sp.]
MISRVGSFAWSCPCVFDVFDFAAWGRTSADGEFRSVAVSSSKTLNSIDPLLVAEKRMPIDINVCRSGSRKLRMPAWLVAGKP